MASQSRIVLVRSLASHLIAPLSKKHCLRCSNRRPCAVVDAALFQETLLSSPDLFPELAGRPLYLLGESYAGVYVPTLAAEILKTENDTSVLNLHGIWVTYVNETCIDGARGYAQSEILTCSCD